MTQRKGAQPAALRAAVIGAGMSGLACARELAAAGVEVVVFDKSRGVGGRMACRRTDQAGQFDHGAQYFTARDPAFQRQVELWLECGDVRLWEGEIAVLNGRGAAAGERAPARRFVGCPAMNAPCKRLAVGLDVRPACRVVAPAAERSRELRDESGGSLGEFDVVLSSAPAPQTADLLAASASIAATARRAEMSPCWAVMAFFDASLPLAFDGAFVHDSPLAWIARDSSKPQRRGPAAGEGWVLHGSPEFSTRSLEDSPEEIAATLLDAFGRATGSTARPRWSTAHRWRYALPTEPLPQRCLWDEQLAWGACGDWCGGPRVEGAYLSGLALARRVLEHALDA